MRILLKNTNIVDSINGIQKGKNILIENHKIISIFGQAEALPQCDEVIDLRGLWVMPGLIDLHVHLNAETGEQKSRLPGGIWRMTTLSPLKVLHFWYNAKKALMSGFTTLRNCGHVTYYTPEDIALREGIVKGLVDGPNIAACAGYITMTAGHGDLTFPKYLRRLPEHSYGDKCFNGVWGCVEGVREKVRMGADFIKVMASGGMGSSGDEPWWPNYTLEELKAIVSEAHDLGKKVAAHTHSLESARRCIEAGIDTIEHGCALTDELCALMAEKGLFYTPTLRVVNILLNSEDPEEKRGAEELVEQHEKAIGYAIKNGVKIGYGTDTINALKHGENGLEILNMLEVGMTNEAVFKAVTYTSAEALGWEKKIGVVGEGYFADLVVTETNPLEDMKILTKGEDIKAVISRGQVVKNTIN